MTLGVLKIVFLPFSTEPSVYNEGVSSILFQIKMTKYNHFFNNYIYKDKTHCYSNIILKCQILQRFCVTTVVIGFIMLKRQKQYNLPLHPLPKMWPWTLAIHNIVKKYHLFHSFIQMITEWPLSSFLVLVFVANHHVVCDPLLVTLIEIAGLLAWIPTLTGCLFRRHEKLILCLSE